MKNLLAALALLAPLAVQAGNATAVFGGGCFWCVEADFEKLPGVTSAVSGYSGGDEQNPTYEQVSDHATGHAEVVQVTYDPAQVSYESLVTYYFHHVDPLTANAQFCDSGPQYRTVIFYGNDSEKQAAENLAGIYERQLGKKIVTQIAPAKTFWPAEDYHQDYYKKNPVRYNFYRYNCGRDARVKQVWGKNAPLH